MSGSIIYCLLPAGNILIGPKAGSKKYYIQSKKLSYENYEKLGSTFSVIFKAKLQSDYFFLEERADGYWI